MGVDKRPTSKSGAAKPPSRSTPVHHDSLSKLYDRLICGVGGVADAAADDNDSDNDSDNDRTTSPRAAPVISPIDAAKLQADVVTMLHRAADHIQSLDPAAESIKTAFDDVVGRCLDMQALIYQTSRSATPPAASVLDDAQLQAAVAAKSATADAAFEELKGVLRSTLENQGQTITACNSFLASLGQDASDFDTATISSIATLSSTVVEFVDMIRKAPKKTDGSSVKAVTRFLATNGLEVASTVISAAKAASQFVPIPGIAVAIGIIDSILSNIKDGMDSIGGLKSFLADLKELKTILAPMANQWFSADVRGKCAELVDLLEDVQDTVILTTRPGRNWLMLVMGSKKAEVEAQIAEFRARLAKIKELISLAMQVDSAVMLMHTAKKLNLIDTKTDKILGLIRPRTLHIRHDDFLVSTAPEDSKGVFLVYKAKMDGSDYVIKEFKKELDEKVREDFLTETRKWFQLSHANLLPITGICLKTPKGSTHRPFIAMPFMEYSLETYLAKYPDLSTQDRLRIISRVARGIKYLHVYAPGAPVLHGSITMRRILLDAKGNKVKIGVGIQSIRALAGPQQATKCMAPEAAVKDYSPKPSLDIYAFAVIAMAVLTRSTIQDLDIETAERPEDVSNELWQCLVKCLGFFKYRPHFDEIVNVLASAVSPINADGGTKLTDGASDLEVLCSIFPDWAKDSEITANAEHLPTGEMLHMYDRLAKRNIPKWRIEWDDTYNLVALRLTGCGLSGAIPKDIGLLTQLRELWLDQNDFEGMIPMELCKLTKLTSLRLGQNNLVGSVPHLLSMLTELHEIDINSNQFETVSSTLSECVNLRILNIAANNITHIPNLEKLTKLEVFSAATRWDRKSLENVANIGNLRNLKTLDLRDNKLPHQLPESIWTLSRLAHLNLSGCKLDSVPSLNGLYLLNTLELSRNNLTCIPEMGHLSCLQELYAGDNKLTSLPDSICQLYSLSILKADKNQIEALPDQIGNLTNLVELGLASNKITRLPDSLCKLVNLDNMTMQNNAIEVLPDNFGDLASLSYLELRNNNLETLPDSFCRLPSLRVFVGGTNKLRCLPERFGDLKSLEVLALRTNNLGTLPESIGSLTSLKRLGFRECQLTSVPDSICNLSNLTRLYLDENHLTKLPDNIGDLTNMFKLNIRDNKITRLPESIGRLVHVQELNVSQNMLEELPQSIGGMRGLEELYTKENKLESLPASIGQLAKLTFLGLSDNQLTHLPDSICNLTHLTQLNLRHNKLKALPESIGNLTALTELILSQNELETLPESITQLRLLKNFNLRQNRLGTLSESVGEHIEALAKK